MSFILKYWNSNLVKGVTSTALGDNTEISSQQYSQSPDELVQDLEEMGPTYIKLGQLLSTRPDLLPKAYLEALATLQDSAEPISYEEVCTIIEDEIHTRISHAFQEFDEKPLASASIGQVHRATLRSGMKVAVKIQRPGIQEKIWQDLDTLREMAEWAVNHTSTARKYALDEVMEDLRRILLNELNYTKEAQNLIRLGKNLDRFDRLIVPAPVMDYSTENMLTMEFIEGQKVVDLSPVKQVEIDCTPLVDELVEAYLQQIIEDGFVHADPHPGNIHFTKTHKIALLDLGMVAQISSTNKDFILLLMLAISNDDGEKAADILIEMGRIQDEHNTEKFRKDIHQLVMESKNTKAKEMKTGQMLIQMNKSAAHNGIILPVDINILGKVLLNLDQIIAVLAPDFDLRDAIKKHIQQLMQSKMLDELKPGSILSTALETKKMAEAMPGRINKFTEQLANNEFTLKIDAIDEKRLTDGFQKVANRITLGLIIAAMIMGAAMLMSVPTNFTILGYPGLAIIFFLFAALGGIGLTYYIIFKDEDFK
ncbi:MAG: AarF/ABC1/UbiB kinase family protein [Balneolaceae bacterium]|nr:AarF/ABC1/UbiB kinase family protein [Balneolaceae bacterium]